MDFGLGWAARLLMCGGQLATTWRFSRRPLRETRWRRVVIRDHGYTSIWRQVAKVGTRRRGRTAVRSAGAVDINSRRTRRFARVSEGPRSRGCRFSGVFVPLGALSPLRRLGMAAVEYALLLAILVIAGAAVWGALSTSMGHLLQTVADSFSRVPNP